MRERSTTTLRSMPSRVRPDWIVPVAGTTALLAAGLVVRPPPRLLGGS
jgi:hypothetical protein